MGTNRGILGVHAGEDVKPAYDEGFKVGESLLFGERNPYQPGTEDQQQWLAGFQAGQQKVFDEMLRARREEDKNEEREEQRRISNHEMTEDERLDDPRHDSTKR